MAPESKCELLVQEGFSSLIPTNRLSLNLWRTAALLALIASAALPSWAVSCTTQGALQPADREALLAAANPIADAVAGQNFDLLQTSLLPAVVIGRAFAALRKVLRQS
jgi:hypothetical protein